MSPYSPTISSLFLNACARHPGRLAVSYDGRAWNYEEWLRRVACLAHAFADLGVEQGGRVAIFLRTSEAAAAAYMACQLLGAVAVPMNFRLSGGEADYIANDCDAALIVFDASVEGAVQRVLESRPQLARVRSGPAKRVDAHDLDQLVHCSTPLREPVAAQPHGHSALVYTSGTTGFPKGVVHTHANDVAIVQNCIMEYRLSAEDVALHIAPLYHVGGMQAFFLPHLMVGAANVIGPRYTPGSTLEDIERHRVTTLFAVPTQIQDMLTHPRFGELDHSSLRLITTGGAALPAATMERVVGEFCAGIYNGYGMTEASLTLLLHPRDALSRLGSCGKPTLISECQLRLADGGVEPTVGEVGELWVRGPQMSPGYWNKPQETAERFSKGWLRTGDLFSRDEDGFFYFHGRVDDMIVTGGENVYPREVEEVLYRCPGVQDVVVLGLPDPKWGHAVAAFIVKKDPELTAEAIDAYCRASGDLAAFKRPRRVEFVDALPMNPSGKVLRRELLARHGAPGAGHD